MSFSRIILAVLLVNTAGITLRYFGLDTYFIFLGFRFHLSCLIPFILLLSKENLAVLLEALKKPRFRRKIIPFLGVFLSLAFLSITMYLIRQIKPGDPDYFYEFGLSSIFDYPLYLLWNFPQLCMIFMVLAVLSGTGRIAFIKVFAGLVLLFGFEFIPFSGEFSLSSTISFLLLALTASFFVTRLQNVYWFSFIVFSSVWGAVLLFGSSSEVIINIFFAREYESWEGFFNAGRHIAPFIIPAFFFILLVITSFYVLISGKKVT